MQKPFACKPVVIIAKASDSVLPRQFGLRFARFRNTKIVKTEIGWQMRLVMTAKKRTCLRYVRPLGKSLTPPRVVFRDRMKLRQIKGDRAYRFIAHLLIGLLLTKTFQNCSRDVRQMLEDIGSYSGQRTTGKGFMNLQFPSFWINFSN
jgi:hypothetical protein